MAAMSYRVNEVFYSLQGEGARAGTPNVFVRLAGCDLACAFCDTEFESYRELRGDQVLEEVESLAQQCGVIFTGGEPTLQLQPDLVANLKRHGFGPICVETNGLHPVKRLELDWVTVSPKTAEHTLKSEHASELKYVRHAGQGIPRPQLTAAFYYVSPEWGERARENLEWCIGLVKANPTWRLSVQQHKLWKVR